MQSIDEVKAHVRQVFVVAFTFCVGVAIAQAEPGGPAAAGVDSRGTAFGKKVKGDLGERMMDDFYISSGYEKVDCSVGDNGADGVYVTRNADGTIDNVIVSECKIDTAQLGRLDSGTGPYQGSKEYYLREIDKKIEALERGPKTPETARQIKDLKQIRRKIANGDYRSRLFKMTCEAKNGKMYIKMQTYELAFENGPNARPTATARGRPAMIDMTSPDSELSPYYRARRNQFYENLKKELLERTKKGGYGVTKPLTEKEAQKVVDEIKVAFESGKIQNKKELISEVAKRCGIGIEEAEEVFEKSIAAESSVKVRATRVRNPSAKELVGDVSKNCKKSRMIKVRGDATADGAKETATYTRRTVARDVTHLKKMEVEFLKKNPNVTKVKTVVGVMKRVTSASGKTGVAFVVPASAVASGVKVAAKAAAVEGCVAFVLSEGYAVCAYAYGGMSEDEFYRETMKNITASAVVGVATLVAVTLGATPGGPVVLAIGIAGYILVDLAFEAAREPPFTLEDVLGITDDILADAYGFLDPKKDPSFLDEFNTPSFLNPQKEKSFLDPPRGKSFLDDFNR